jgi:hypothetical protein
MHGPSGCAVRSTFNYLMRDDKINNWFLQYPWPESLDEKISRKKLLCDENQLFGRVSFGKNVEWACFTSDINKAMNEVTRGHEEQRKSNLDSLAKKALYIHDD